MPREKKEPKFAENEKILCFHGPMLYEARCLKVEAKDSGYKYFVHYQGWNKGWDEWVSDTRMMKFNQAGLQKQKELEKIFLKSGRKVKALRKSDLRNQSYPPHDGPDGEAAGDDRQDGSAGPVRRSGSTAGSTSSAAPPSGPKETKRSAASMSDAGSTASVDPPAGTHVAVKKKRSQRGGAAQQQAITTVGLDLAVLEMEPSLLARLQVKIEIPDLLKAWLADDCDLVTRQSKLFRIPARVNIEKIFQKYVTWKRDSFVHELSKKDALHMEQIKEMMKGLKDYFNEMLGSQLLYKFERHQYADALEAYNDKMTQLFGIIHLLRLLSKLGEFLAYTKLDPKTTPVLISHLHDFLSYVNSNIDSMVTDDDYYVATPDYQRRAMC